VLTEGGGAEVDVSVQLKWISAVVGVIGLWLIVGPPFLFEAPFADFWSDLIVGFVLLSLAIYTYARRASASSQWAMAAATVFGGWVILGAFLWGTSTILFWNDLLAGGIVAVFAGYSAYEARETYASNGNSSEDSDDSSRNTEGDSGEDSGDGSNGDSNDGSSGSSGDDSSDDESDDSDESDNDSSDGDSSDDGDGDGDSEADSSGGG
jgi:hypothetical protein